MIHIVDKRECCGCGACIQRCPKHCIRMVEDEEGFLYPNVETELCIDCGICEKVCPEIHRNEPRQPLSVFAAKNPNDEVRLQSSSGGIFTMLAEKIIEEGGVVFGVGYNDHWEAAHYYTETKEGLAAFRMSKYVQSIVGNTFKEAETFLKSGRKVLYSGTPCQIAGLKRFLRKEYNNLLALDFICHGTPSPGIFRWFLAEEFAKHSSQNSKPFKMRPRNIPSIPKADILAQNHGFEIKDIRFRDKKIGWKNFSFVLDVTKDTDDKANGCTTLSFVTDKDQNTFLRGFLSDLYLRPSCEVCPVKELRSGADITIGDFWGFKGTQDFSDDDKGVSAILLVTQKGADAFNGLDVLKINSSLEDVSKYNDALSHSASSPYRTYFFRFKRKPLRWIVRRITSFDLKDKILRKIWLKLH